MGSAGILPAGFGILPNLVIQRAAKGSRKVKVQPPTTTQPVIYHSKRHHTTKRNFGHIPPRGPAWRWPHPGSRIHLTPKVSAASKSPLHEFPNEIPWQSEAVGYFSAL